MAVSSERVLLYYSDIRTTSEDVHDSSGDEDFFSQARLQLSIQFVQSLLLSSVVKYVVPRCYRAKSAVSLRPVPIASTCV